MSQGVVFGRQLRGQNDRSNHSDPFELKLPSRPTQENGTSSEWSPFPGVHCKEQGTTHPWSVQNMPGMPMPGPLAGSEGPPSLAMAAWSAAILAWRFGSVVVRAFFRFWKSVTIELAWVGRDAGRREVGRQVGRGITAGGSALRPTGVQGLPLSGSQRGERLPDDGPIGLDRRGQARRNLSLERFLVVLKGLEIGLKLGARLRERVTGETWTTQALGSAMEIEGVRSSRSAFQVEGVHVRSRTGSCTRGSVPPWESLRPCPCGIQELPPFQRLARRSMPDLHSRRLRTRGVNSVEDAQQCLQGIHRYDSILPGIAFSTGSAHADRLASFPISRIQERKRAPKNAGRVENLKTWSSFRRRSEESVSRVSATRSLGLNQTAEEGGTQLDSPELSCVRISPRAAHQPRWGDLIKPGVSTPGATGPPTTLPSPVGTTSAVPLAVRAEVSPLRGWSAGNGEVFRPRPRG